MTTLLLPAGDGKLERYTLQSPALGDLPPRPAFDRVVYAAAHVVVDPTAESAPWQGRPAIDWERTIAYRHHLWGLGFKVAEAMDTAQRGMGVDWPTARALIARSLAAARSVPGADLAAGAGTDQIAADRPVSLDEVRRAYIEQIEAIEALGGRVILMASRALARAAGGPDDYQRLYGALIAGCRDKVILHWLGSVFDPALAGYWGSTEIARAMDIVMSIISDHRDKIDGIKISLLDKRHEVALRARLPEGVRMYTGDDFNYPEMIQGDGTHVSHGLLGIFDPIAPVAARALARLAVGDAAGFRTLIDPTVALSRRIFEAPTQYYKAGVVLLAWLNGHQNHFTMAGGLQSARGICHYADVFRLADAAGVLENPDLACKRMASLLHVYGVDA